MKPGSGGHAAITSLPEPYYESDGIVLYHADARDILPLLEARSVDFIFTDPPYGHNNNDGDLAHRREAALGILPPGATSPGDDEPCVPGVRVRYEHPGSQQRPGRLTVEHIIAALLGAITGWIIVAVATHELAA